MDFVRSRLALIGLLVAWPCAQLAGCAVKGREYGPASEGGTGGTNSNGGTGGSKGGTSGKGNGGTTGTGATGGTEGGMAGEVSMSSGGSTAAGGTTGGSSTGSGGKGGSRGGTNAAGGTTGGTDTSGTAGEAGASGEGGMSGSPSGGTGGTGVVCVPTGTTENCSDGIDNNCDGITDCLTLTSEYPDKTGVAAASEVAYTFAAHAASGTFQCRNTHGTTGSGSFGSCAGVSGNTVQPFSAAFAQNATNDGLWTTEVRLHFPDGGTSTTYKRTVYVHHTLYGVAHCPTTTTDQAYADFAKSKGLTDAGAIDETNAKSPFVQVTFTPYIDATFSVNTGEGVVNWKSLRRHFGFSSDGHYLVMTRTYTARNADTGMGCYAAVKRVHTHRGDRNTPVTPAPNPPYQVYQACTAMVFNKKGAGYCVGYSGTAPTAAEYPWSSSRFQPPNYSAAADNLAWRKMTAHLGGGWGTNFSPKCDVDGCAANDVSGYTIFLPDKAFFPYFTN